MAVRGQWGEPHQVFLYLVDIEIGDIVLTGLEVVGDRLSDELIIGRDVLNLLRLYLDGPAETTEISE